MNDTAEQELRDTLRSLRAVRSVLLTDGERVEVETVNVLDNGYVSVTAHRNGRQYNRKFPPQRVRYVETEWVKQSEDGT